MEKFYEITIVDNIKEKCKIYKQPYKDSFCRIGGKEEKYLLYVPIYNSDIEVRKMTW